MNQKFALSFKSKIDPILYGCWSLAFIALIFSFSHEFIGKVKPCMLCKIQRLPFAFIFLFMPLGMIFFSNASIKKIVAVALITSFLIASFHFLIQLKIIPDTCAIPHIQTIEDFEKMLEYQPPCSKISWAILGLPISIYNAAISFIFFVILLIKKI